MPVPGDKAKVLSSTGFHSKKYVGQTGIVVGIITSPKKQLCVLKFPSNGIEGVHGLYLEEELEWQL